jgi:hypothetical protein
MALTKAELAQQAQLKLVNDLSAGTITQAQFQTGIAKINAQLLKEQAPTQDTAANKLASTPPPAAGSVDQINQQYTQYQVNLANDLKSGKITQTQFQNEFEKLRAQQNEALSRVPAVSKTEDARIANNSPAIVADATSSASEVTNSEPIKATTSNNKKKKDPISNPLLAYPSYTYGLSLALLTVKEYNDIVSDVKNYQSNRVIIASAGRWNNDEGVSMFKRAPFFAEDFYFDNLDMTTVIGLNDQSRSTNAINLKFSIIEPYGVTLLNRILDLSADIKSLNYIAQPYLLQIDFFGMNDAGEIVGIIPDQTKRIPIRILKMDIKASAKGAEYQMEACPYSHSAYDLSTVTTPANFEITAGTLESFLQSTTEETAFADAKSQREGLIGKQGRFQQAANGTITQRGGTGEVVSLAFVGTGSAIDTNSIMGKDAVYKVKSYGGAISAYYADVAAREKTAIADKYYFKVHPDIIKDGGTQFNLNIETLSTAQTPMASEENGMSIRGTPGSLDHGARVFAINTGTSIDQVIAFAMRHTKYLQGQVQPVSKFKDDAEYKKYLESQANEPLKWYKVVPTIKLGEYNIPQETWAREITYHILPYTVYNTKTREGPQGTWTEPCKLHNYWYTGKNNDVLDFNVEFNALYYTAVTAYRENLSKTQNLLEDETTNAKITKESRDANAVMPLGAKKIVLNSQQQSTGGAVTVEAIALADIEASLYTTAGGDMLQAKLKIIGDPQYIKQDDVFYPPEMTVLSDQVDGTGIDPRLIANGSLRMDQGEIYVQITVKSPSDIDEATGLMKFDSKYSTSLFSGMYRVLKVESHFTGGKFEQTLDVVRLPRQTSLEPNYPSKTASKEREVAVAPLSTDVDAQANIGPDFSVKPIDEKAPGSAPVDDDTTAPLQTPEERALAKVDATATETAITTQTEPVSTPSPVPPSAEKLALKAQLDSATDTFNGAANASATADSAVAKIQSQIETTLANLDRYPDRVARGLLTQAEAAPLIADNQRRLTALQNQLATAQATAQAAQPAYDAAKAARDAAKAQYNRAI